MSLISEIQQQLDEAGGPVFWTLQDIYDSANEAIVDIYAATRHENVLATVTLTSNTATFDLPATVMIPQFIVSTGGLRYFPTTQAKLEQYNAGWRGEGLGTPKHFLVEDASSLRAFPAPDATYNFIIHGVPWPSCGEIVNGNENPTLARQLKEAIIRRACADLLDLTQPSLAEQMMAESADALREYKITLRNRNSHNIRRLRPGTIFTKANQGIVSIGRKYS